MPKNKFRLTKSLIDSWLWSFKSDDGYDNFIKSLNRQKIPMTTAILNGVKYENILNSVLRGEKMPDDHEWRDPILEMAEELEGSQQQVVLFKDIEVDGVPFLLHGVLDYLKAGVIYDCKFSKHYYLNKYFSNTVQHQMYMELVPEAYLFEYVISDGKNVYREKYPRYIVDPIEPIIKNFMQYLDRHNLVDTYVEHWRVNE